MTGASSRMMERIAERSGGAVEQAARSVINALGGILFGRPIFPVHIFHRILRSLLIKFI